MDFDPAYEELLSKLDGLKGEGRKKAMRKSLGAVGKLLKGAIQERAPVLDKQRGSFPPGALRDGVTARIHIAKDENPGSDTDRVVIGPSKATAGLASMVENGHENKRGKKSSGAQTSHGRTPAHPYTRPAWDAKKEEAVALFESTAAEEIERQLGA